MNYSDYSDEELLYYIYDNNEQAHEIIYNKYMPLIINIATKMIGLCKNKGVELNDLIQEGRIGLSKAIDDYRNTKEASFGTFAKLCIERKILSFIRSSNSQKHSLLNDSISYEITGEDNSNLVMEPVLEDKSENPEEFLINKERESILLKNIEKSLTKFEKEVFELRLDGCNYEEISKKLNSTKKAVDNALQRIKNKIKKILEEI